MKGLFLIILTIFILGKSNIVSAQFFKNRDLQISKLEENVWVIETTDNTTMYLIEGKKKALLIDTGTKCDSLNDIVRLITDKPLYVVLTHLHLDHAGNIGYFNDVYYHPADTVLLSHLNTYKGNVHYLYEGEVFDLGDKEIEVIQMPAHTPGSVVFLDRKAGICYSGDAFGSGMVWLQLKPVSPMLTYINSCKKMETIMDSGITKLYCGHYPYVKKAFDKSYIVAMRKLAEQLDNGTAPESKPYDIKYFISCENPFIVSDGNVSIVYDKEHLK